MSVTNRIDRDLVTAVRLAQLDFYSIDAVRKLTACCSVAAIARAPDVGVRKLTPTYIAVLLPMRAIQPNYQCLQAQSHIEKTVVIPAHAGMVV